MAGYEQVRVCLGLRSCYSSLLISTHLYSSCGCRQSPWDLVDVASLGIGQRTSTVPTLCLSYPGLVMRRRITSVRENSGKTADSAHLRSDRLATQQSLIPASSPSRLRPSIWLAAALTLCACGEGPNIGDPDIGGPDVGGPDVAADAVATVTDVLTIQDAGSSVDAGCKTATDCPAGPDLCFPATCVVGKCMATVTTCLSDQDTACVRNRCNPATGQCLMTAAPKGTPCVDGDACTLEDACDAGVCAAGPSSQCACTNDDHCENSDNKCLGERYCDKSTMPYKCKINEATVRLDPKSVESDLGGCGWATHTRYG